MTADDVRIGQMVWIEHRNNPGGLAVYIGDHGLTWFSILGSAADVTANLMGDTLLVRTQHRLNFQFLTKSSSIVAMSYLALDCGL